MEKSRDELDASETAVFDRLEQIQQDHLQVLLLRKFESIVKRSLTKGVCDEQKREYSIR